MDTTKVIGVALAFGVATFLLAGPPGGVGAFDDRTGSDETTRTLEEIGQEASVQDENGGGVGAEVGGDNEPSVVGFALSGGEFIVNLVAAVVLIPGTLNELGFPNYFAQAVGRLAQIIAVIGLYQFVGNRIYK